MEAVQFSGKLELLIIMYCRNPEGDLHLKNNCCGKLQNCVHRLMWYIQGLAKMNLCVSQGLSVSLLCEVKLRLPLCLSITPQLGVAGRNDCSWIYSVAEEGVLEYINGRLDIPRAPDGNGAWNYGSVCGELMSFGGGGGISVTIVACAGSKI